MKDSFKSDKYDTPVGLHRVAIGPSRQHTSKPTVHIDAKAKKLFFFILLEQTYSTAKLKPTRRAVKHYCK